MQPKICAFTGHRPAKIPNGHNEQSPGFQSLHAAIETTIRQAISEGFSIFRSGGAMGFDLWCAKIVLALNRNTRIFDCILFCHAKHRPAVGRSAGASSILIYCPKPMR